MGEQIPLIDVLKSTVQMLGNISVPRVLNEQIGKPIDTAIGNLQACVEAIEKGGEANGNADAE